MNKNEDSGSPGWLGQTTEEVAKKFQRHVTRVLQGFSSPPQDKRRTYNPEILTSHKRQWARFQLRSLDQRSIKEPSNIFESLVVVGLHPSCDLQTLQKKLLRRNSDGSKKSRVIFDYSQRVEEELHIEPQVLFAYPPKKRLPFKYRDLVSFCFPGGLEVRAVERTPSMSELNEILLGQEHLKQSDLSFVFRLQGPDGAPFYGCCILVEEIIQKPSGLLARLREEKTSFPFSSRCILTAPRCYCIISRLPFFDLHFGVLKSVFTEERLERLTEDIGFLSLISQEGYPFENDSTETSNNVEHCHQTDMKCSSSKGTSDAPAASEDGQTCSLNLSRGNNNITVLSENLEIIHAANETGYTGVPQNGKIVIDTERDKLALEKHFPDVALPLLKYHYESSDSTSFQGSPCEDRNSQSEHDDTENEETSSSGREDFNDQSDILEWAKANNHGCLQIICEYYKLNCPARGSKLTFHPLEHLHPLYYCRPGETLLLTSGSTIDIRTCSTSLEVSEAHNALFALEETTALAVWAVACVCGNLRLENVLTLFAGALLEKQIVVLCSNLGVLSAIVLSVIPLIRPYQWQCPLMPVLPNDMLDFLDAPVPYVVGIKNKTAEVQSKLSNVILVDANRNQVKSSSMPKLPRQNKLQSDLSTYHSILVGESFLARRRPVYECTDTQVEAAKGFLAVLKAYLENLCSHLRYHTITNVQSNDDKVSLLLKESFIDSFSYRERPFMKQFVDTQLFSMHTDLILSVIQKE